MVQMGISCLLYTSSGPAIEKPGDLAALLTNLGDGDVLFIDEIHPVSYTHLSVTLFNSLKRLVPNQGILSV